MRNRWTLPLLALALLASPLAATLCAAGACSAVAAVESHCAMAPEGSAATRVEASRTDCCNDLGPTEPATASATPHLPPVLGTPAVALPGKAPDGRPTGHEEAASARGGPNERLHRLGALLL